MKVTRANAVWLHVSAVLSLVCWLFVCYCINDYLKQYKALLGPPSERDIWEGGDVVQAIKQRAQTAALYLQGFSFSLAIILFGATAQSLLAFKRTKDISTMLRLFFQVELVYQVIKSHQTGVKKSAEEQQSQRYTAHVSRMSNCCTFFLLSFLGYMSSFVSILQRPLRTTVDGWDMDVMWLNASMLFAMYVSITIAQHLGDADWSMWHARPRPQLIPNQGVQQDQQPEVQGGSSLHQSPGASQHTTREVAVPKAEQEQNMGPRQVLKGFLRAVVCGVSVFAHMSVYLLLSVGIRGFILCVVIGYWVLNCLLYYAVTGQLAKSLFWGCLSNMLHVGFNRTTHRKAWWVAVVMSILFSSVGIACGLLQCLRYVFTKRYTTAEYTGGTNKLGHVAFEQSVGMFAVAACVADLVVYAVTVLVHVRRAAAHSYESEVQMPDISV